MSLMDRLVEFYYGPAFGKMILVLCSYLAVYVGALILTRIWMSLRRGSRPTVDQIAHRVLGICFLLCLVLPVFFVFQLVAQYPWHTIPFAIAILLDVMILTRLFGRLRGNLVGKPVRSSAHATH